MPLADAVFVVEGDASRGHGGGRGELLPSEYSGAQTFDVLMSPSLVKKTSATEEKRRHTQKKEKARVAHGLRPKRRKRSSKLVEATAWPMAPPWPRAVK